MWCSQVDPTAQLVAVWRAAIQADSLECAQLLLSDPRIDPEAHDQFALLLASELGSVAMVELLLADERVDPLFNDCRIIRAAIGQNWSKCTS
jgi:hypothetical protein